MSRTGNSVWLVMQYDDINKFESVLAVYSSLESARKEVPEDTWELYLEEMEVLS